MGKGLQRFRLDSPHNVSPPPRAGGFRVLQCNTALFVKNLCLFRCYKSVTKVLHFA